MAAFRSIRRTLPINSWKEILAVCWNVDQLSDSLLLISERSLLEQLPADGLALPLASEGGRDEGPAHLVAQWHGPHPPPPSLLTRYDPLFLHVDYIPQPSRASYIYPLQCPESIFTPIAQICCGATPTLSWPSRPHRPSRPK